MPEFSVIMPVRNAAATIGEAVAGLERQTLADWELVVVDDRSDDGTVRTVEALRAGEPRLKLVTNRGTGQVDALNTGYPLTSGRFVKFADGDDVLSPLLSVHFGALTAAEAAYHDIEIVRPDLTRINIQHYGDLFRTEPFVRQFRPGIVHPSRSAWMFSRRVADRLFPLPSRLASPHEDYWIALALKKHAAGLAYVPEPIYLYRQHAGQIFGGVYNFAPEVVIRRARAMLRVLDVILEEGAVLTAGEPEIPARLAAMRTYYGLLARDALRWKDIWGARLAPAVKTKMALIKKCPRTASTLSRLKSERSRGIFKRMK